MTEFPAYPGSNPGAPGAPGERYVVAVTCSLDKGAFGPELITGPMTYEAAQDLMGQVAAGQSCDALPDGADLVAEVSPGHLVAMTNGGILTRSVLYDVRLARVLVG